MKKIVEEALKQVTVLFDNADDEQSIVYGAQKDILEAVLLEFKDQTECIEDVIKLFNKQKDLVFVEVQTAMKRNDLLVEDLIIGLRKVYS